MQEKKWEMEGKGEGLESQKHTNNCDIFVVNKSNWNAVSSVQWNNFKFKKLISSKLAYVGQWVCNECVINLDYKSCTDKLQSIPEVVPELIPTESFMD